MDIIKTRPLNELSPGELKFLFGSVIFMMLLITIMNLIGKKINKKYGGKNE